MAWNRVFLKLLSCTPKMYKTRFLESECDRQSILIEITPKNLTCECKIKSIKSATKSAAEPSLLFLFEVLKNALISNVLRHRLKELADCKNDEQYCPESQQQLFVLR